MKACCWCQPAPCVLPPHLRWSSSPRAVPEHIRGVWGIISISPISYTALQASMRGVAVSSCWLALLHPHVWWSAVKRQKSFLRQESHAGIIRPGHPSNFQCHSNRCQIYSCHSNFWHNSIYHTHPAEQNVIPQSAEVSGESCQAEWQLSSLLQIWSSDLRFLSDRHLPELCGWSL